jgi:hypothetical protein
MSAKSGEKIETNDEMWLFSSYCSEAGVEAVTDVLRRGTWWAKGPEIEEILGYCR